MSNGSMAIQPRFTVVVKAKRIARTVRLKNVLAWDAQEAIRKVEEKMGNGWRVVEAVTA